MNYIKAAQTKDNNFNFDFFFLSKERINQIVNLSRLPEKFGNKFFIVTCGVNLVFKQQQTNTVKVGAFATSLALFVWYLKIHFFLGTRVIVLTFYYIPSDDV